MASPRPDHGADDQWAADLSSMVGDLRGKYTIDVPMVIALRKGYRPLTHNDRLHWRPRAERVATIRHQVSARARAQKIPASDRITVTLHYQPGNMRSVTDAPNLTATSKPAIDGLVDAGIVPDDTDRYVNELMPIIHTGPGDRRLWLTVEVQA